MANASPGMVLDECTLPRYRLQVHPAAENRVHREKTSSPTSSFNTQHNRHYLVVSEEDSSSHSYHHQPQLAQPAQPAQPRPLGLRHCEGRHHEQQTPDRCITPGYSWLSRKKDLGNKVHGYLWNNGSHIDFDLAQSRKRVVCRAESKNREDGESRKGIDWKFNDMNI